MKVYPRTFKVTPSGLRYKILNKGNGDSPKKGDKVKVHYKGMLTDETVFDSSYKRNQPIEFNVGIGQVIPGWDEGIMLLRRMVKRQNLLSLQILVMVKLAQVVLFHQMQH